MAGRSSSSASDDNRDEKTRFDGRKSTLGLQIVQGAARAFVEQGYRSTSMDDIAVAAGVARRSIYHHFKSKKEILAAVCIEQARQFLQRVGEDVEVSEDFPAYISDCLFYIIDQSPDSPLFMLHSSQGAEYDPVAFYFSNTELINEWIEFFQRPYIEALRKRQINPEIKLEKLVNWFGRLSTSMLQFPLAGESREEIRENIRLFFENALRYGV